MLLYIEMRPMKEKLPSLPKRKEGIINTIAIAIINIVYVTYLLIVIYTLWSLVLS